MTGIKSLFIQPVVRSSLPLFIGGTYHLLRALFLSGPNHSDDLISHDDNLKDQVQNNEGIVLGFLTILNQISFGIYSNFSVFLLVMLLIDLIFKIAQQGVKASWKEISRTKSKSRSFQDDSVITASLDKEPIRLFYTLSESQIIRILFYVLLFAMIQISGYFFSFAQNEAQSYGRIGSSQNAGKISLMNKEENYLNRIPRILEEEVETTAHVPAISTETSSLSSEKFSLSMGTVLGSLNIDVYDMIISKDRRTAFVILAYYGTLNIIDISDLQNPTVKSSLNLKALQWSYRVKSLALSSDEKTLYATGCRDLEIIDVTDLGSPKLISTTNSEILTGMEQVSSYKLLKPTLIVDEKREILFIGGLGLQIYNISNPKNPALLSARKIYEDNFGDLSVNELCLSRDQQVLFIANGTLDVYDVSNPKDLKPLHSLKTESSSRSILLSDDGKRVFLVGVDSSGEIRFEEVDVSNPKDSISVRKTTKLGFKNRLNPRFLGVYPSKTKFFISIHNGSLTPDLLVFDSVKQKTNMNEKGLIEATNVIDFSPDGKTFITGSSSQLMAVELLFYYPNSQIFSGTAENLKLNIPMPSRIFTFEVSKDGQFLFLVRPEGDSYLDRHMRIFEIWDLRNVTSPELLTSYHSSEEIEQMHLMKDSNIVYFRTFSTILELDVSDKSSISVKNTHKEERFESFVTSPDEKTGFFLKFKDNIGEIKLLNLENFEEISTLDQKFDSRDKIILPKDDRTLLVFDKEEILIYNISNLDNPTQITSFFFIKNEPAPIIHSAVFSSNTEILFVETFDQNGFRKLRIYNFSDVKSPQLISEKYFTRVEAFKMLYRKALFSLSADQKMGYVPQADSLIKVNLTDLKNLEVVGVIPLRREGLSEIEKYIISPDGNRIYTTIKNQFHIVNPTVKYSLYLNKERFVLEEKYSEKVLMLNRTSEEPDYNILKNDAYKIVKMSLLDIKITPTDVTLAITASPLPSWITFDSDRDILSVEPKKLRDIGTYALHAALSLKVPLNVFDNSNIGEIVVSENLIAWLISLDYLDSELFLTAKFKSIETFYLPVQFFKYKAQIYNILKGFYVETCTLFEVGSSLVVNENDLKVSTLSTNEIKAEVKLEPAEGTEAKFVNVGYGGLLPSIRENKTKVVFEGTIGEINTALGAIVVNFENGTSCNASLLINDGFNPPVSVELVNISRYFRANNQPKLNHNTEKTLQEQIDSADIQTGKYFAFTLTDDIFKDDYAESLTYELVMEKNDTGFPNWLSLSGLTLKGTPPEEILGRDMNFILIAKNEFKQYEVAFRLHIKMSIAFWLKLLLRYSPYILTVIGLFVSANKIYDILAKRQYKHPKEYHIGTGEETSPEVIQPILFIEEELKQSQMILKYFSKEGAGGGLKDFVDSETGVLDKQKIKEEIKESVQRMPVKEKERITQHPSQVIDTIIVNKYIQMQLDSDEQTKRLFEKLESKCLEVVETDAQSSEFVINQGNMKKLLALFDEENPSNNDDLEENLIPEVNLELLKDAILAYAFEKHCINISPVNVDIEVKQQIQSRFLFRFLKLNLRTIYFNEKNKIDYGINYRIIDDKLLFYGVTQIYFQSKTLAIQIKNRRHKIMKEIWIHGGSSDSSGGVMRESRSQLQEYEIF